jgi:hypothetical protein
MADEQTQEFVAPTEDPTSVDAVEEKRVVKWQAEYKAAYDFDSHQRKQYAIDRKYAAGTVDETWASDANLIGSFIDILVSFLYAKDPDVDARPAEQAGNVPDENGSDFAQTARLVVSKLWKRGRLKAAAKKQVRSALSVGTGWFKACLLTETRRDPEIAHALNDLQDNLKRIQAKRKELMENGVEDVEVAEQELETQIAGLEAQVEVVVRRGLAIDFIPSDNVQVSLDIAETSDYLEADWIGHDLYVPMTSLRERFERLTEADVKSATVYYQSAPAAEGDSPADPDDKGMFSKKAPARNSDGSEPVKFARVTEIWSKRDNHIYTIVEGVKRWAREPYPPPYASSRFYPFFRLSFFEVDGCRHPQSLSWRLRKLQDEYAETRSNGRLTRQRSVPGTLFNASQVDEENAKKIAQSETQEFVGVKLTSPDTPMNHVFAAKPVPTVAPGMYDTTAILRDMERISGVQEALQSSVATPKTATEAQIQQSGFASRSSADRDTLEDMLAEFALYTLEVALQGLDLAYARRCAGPAAFWPEDMDIEDILTMVEVEIDAGSTGRPNLAADREAWGVLLPLLQQMLLQIRQLQTIDPPMAEAMSNLLRETARRLDDRIDVDSLLPAGQPPAPPPMPKMEGMPADGAPPPEGVPAEAAPPPEQIM